MSIRFIIGRAGAGKTRACLEAIRKELLARPYGPPLILLVPEQATFQIEYALAATPGLSGFIRARVLSFRRLAYRVLREVGGAARAHIGELGKRMVLRRLLEQRRSELRVLGRSSGRPGFADTLARTLGEMKTYCIGPDELARAAFDLREKGGAALLADKLEDLAKLCFDLEDYLAGRFTDPDDYLNLLADRLELSAEVRGTEVWVDGFSGFTPQEYRVLAALARTASRVNITLCADPAALSGRIDETSLFFPVRETYDRLLKMALQERIPLERPLILGGNTARFKSPAISHLEKYFFVRPAPPCLNRSEGVVLAAAANPKAEAEGVAREITALCRDRGYRYRDIVILLRDVDSYAGLISSIFADHGIPVFIDQKRPVMHHPMVELVRSALEAVTEDWAFDPVFRYLKTDLVPLSREEVDLLENYVLAHGIRGSRWTDGRPWEYRRELTLGEDPGLNGSESVELEKVNRIRHQATADLLEFCRSFMQAKNVREMSTALFNLLTGLKVPEQLESWSRQAEKEGRLEAAREHSLVWSGFTALLDQVVEALGDEVLEPGEYAAVIDAGLESLRLGLIPPGLDQVLVASLERSRNPEMRAAFVMGVNDGVLPARTFDQGIFSDLERERLKAAGLELAPGGRRKFFEEQYLVYIALTRSSERIYLSYPLADGEGRALMPSPIVARVKELLPDVEERVWPVEPNAALLDDLEFVTGPRRTLSYLASQMREFKAGRRIDPLWWDVYSWFAAGEMREHCKRVLSGLFHSNREDRLPPAVSMALYGRPLRASVSGLEKFRACPFAHFLSYGLKLKERAIFKLDAPDLGRFFHAALKLFGDRVREQGLDWGQLDREQCQEMAGEVVDLLAPRLSSEILLSTARRRYLTGKLRRTVQRAALVLAEHSRRSKFRPVGLELSFGPDGDLPAAVFTLADGSEMAVSGRIDRIEAAPSDEGVYLRVIDFKSGKVTVKLTDIYHGLKLQLLAYLDVALEHARTLTGGNGLPGAVLYFRIDDPLVNTDGPVPPGEEVEREILKKLRMTGLVLADPKAVRLMDAGLDGISDLIPVQIKADGSFAARSAVLTREQFALLRSYLRFQLASAGSEIIGGTVEIAPYRKGPHRSCQSCPFRPVCQFDLLVDGNVYRSIKDEDEGAIWSKLGRMCRKGWGQ
ncbi:MAG: helicase-exonuclease AddAB subunit AddB [Pelotomaculum sp.]|nr:helicase-exonuclease AddAB subunit AddB [Pelotomaculum sp.]